MIISLFSRDDCDEAYFLELEYTNHPHIIDALPVHDLAAELSLYVHHENPWYGTVFGHTVATMCIIGALLTNYKTSKCFLTLPASISLVALRRL